MSLATAKGLRTVGVTTVYGNAPLSETDAGMREPIGEIGRHAGHGGPAIPSSLDALRRGAMSGFGRTSGRTFGGGRGARAGAGSGGNAIAGIARGLARLRGSGSLTCLAAVLSLEPELGQRIARITTVMNRKPGHVSHPSENQGLGAMLFGQEPIFRDLYSVLDPESVSVVLQSGIPLELQL